MILLLSLLTMDTLSQGLNLVQTVSGAVKPQGMSVMESVFTYVVAPLVTIVGTWLATKLNHKRTAKKAEANARISELQNVERAIKIWSDIAERLEKKLLQRDQEVHELKLQLNAVLEKLTQIEKDYSRLVKTHAELKKELSSK